MKRIAVFASGSGTNFQRIADAQGEAAGYEVVACVCDRPGAYVLTRADQAGIPAISLSPKHFSNKASYETEIMDRLQALHVDYIVLAGYMRLIGTTLLAAFSGRIINIHPSLLPAFPGLDAIGQALAAGVKTTGVTVHFVDEGMDTGPIIAQQYIEILPEDTLASLTEKIHAVEHQLYPSVVSALCSGKFDMNDREGMTIEN